MRKLVIPVLLTLGLAVAFACSSEEDTPPSNTNQNEPADAAEPGADAAQAGADAAQPGPDAATAGPDAGADAGPDAGGPTTWTVKVGSGGANFNPATLTIKAGDTVTWQVLGGSHNVVSGTACTPDNKFCNPSDANCGAAPTMTTGGTYSHTFTASGAFPYFCAPHCGGGMVGTITVTP